MKTAPFKIQETSHFGWILYAVVYRVLCPLFFIENDPEILHVYYTCKVTFITSLIHEQSIELKL